MRGLDVINIVVYGCTRNADIRGMDVIKVAVWMHSLYGFVRDGCHQGWGMDAPVIRTYAGWTSSRLGYGCARNTDMHGFDDDH